MRPATVAVGVLLLAAATILPLFRQTGARSWQTIWAEDGSIYFQQAKQSGGVAVLLRSYRGYEQLPPRLLAVFSTAVPLHQVAIYLAISSSLVAALLAWFLYHHSAGWITSRPVRLALAALLVLMPALAAENTANITNTIWAFAAVTPWALISLRDRRRDIVVRSVVVFLAATATSLCLLFIPLAIGYALIRRAGATWVVASAFLGGLLVQVAVILDSHYQSSALGHATDSVLVQAMAVRVFAIFLIGTRGQHISFGSGGERVLIVAAVICVVVLAVLFLGAGRKSQVLGIVFIAYAVVTFAFPSWYRNAAGTGVFTSPFRFSVIPVMMLGSAVAVLVAPADSSRDRKIARIGRPVFAVYILLLIATGFSVTNTRSSGPTWSASVTQTYRSECLGAEPDKSVAIPTEKPSWLSSSPQFPVTLPCRDLSP